MITTTAAVAMTTGEMDDSRCEDDHDDGGSVYDNGRTDDSAMVADIMLFRP